MRVYEGPCACVGRVLRITVEEPDERYYKGVVGPPDYQLFRSGIVGRGHTSDRAGATNPRELVISLCFNPLSTEELTDTLLLDLILGPSILMFIVQKDGLENVILKRLVLVELVLER